MTDALERLEDLAPRIASAKKSLAFGAAADKARIPVEQAPRHALLLTRLVQCAYDLDGLNDAALRQRLSGAIAKAESVGESLEDAETADELEAAAADYPMVGSALMQVIERLRNHWSQLVAQDFVDLAAVGHLLSKIAGAEAIGHDLVEISTAAQTLANGDPSAEKLAEGAPALRLRRAQTLDAMQAFTDEPEVDTFLEAVTRQEASLDMVTPKVMAWLTEKDALSAFRVRG